MEKTRIKFAMKSAISMMLPNEPRIECDLDAMTSLYGMIAEREELRSRIEVLDNQIDRVIVGSKIRIKKYMHLSDKLFAMTKGILVYVNSNARQQRKAIHKKKTLSSYIRAKKSIEPSSVRYISGSQ